MQRDVGVTMRSGMFAITTPFALNYLAKDMPNRTWVKSAKVWVGPVNRANAEYLIVAIDGDNWTDEAKAAALEASNDRPVRVPFPRYHDFGLYEPRDEKQIEALDAAYNQIAYALFIIMGKGKTYISIQLALRYWDEARIDKVLVVCPVSIRESAWVNEGWKKFAGHVEHEVTICPRYPAPNPISASLQVMIVGTESLSAGGAMGWATKFVDDRTMVIVDESSKIKNHKANRTANVEKLCRAGKYKIILTGTPITQGIQDLYAQFHAIDPDIIGHKSFYTFRNRYCVMGGYQGRTITGYKNTEQLMEYVRPYVYQDDDKSDLPDKIYMPDRVVTLTKEQTDLIKDLKAQMHVELDGKKLSVDNVIGWMVRAQQIVGGSFPYKDVDEHGEEVWKTTPLVTSPKVDELVELLNDQPKGTKTIVWARFRPEIAEIYERLSAAGFICGQLHGGIKQANRASIVHEFQNGSTEVFVSNQATGGMGLTLTAATSVVYYSNTFSYEDRVQSEDRAHRIGQLNHVTYTNILSKAAIDRTVMQILAKKGGLADFVRDAMMEEIL